MYAGATLGDVPPISPGPQTGNYQGGIQGRLIQIGGVFGLADPRYSSKDVYRAVVVLEPSEGADPEAVAAFLANPPVGQDITVFGRIWGDWSPTRRYDLPGYYWPLPMVALQSWQPGLHEQNPYQIRREPRPEPPPTPTPPPAGEPPAVSPEPEPEGDPDDGRNGGYNGRGEINGRGETNGRNGDDRPTNGNGYNGNGTQPPPNGETDVPADGGTYQPRPSNGDVAPPAGEAPPSDTVPSAAGFQMDAKTLALAAAAAVFLLPLFGERKRR